MKALAAIFCLISCSHIATKRDTHDPLVGKEKLTLLMTSARLAELEPCGCDMAPTGGLVREHNKIQQWKKTIGGNFLGMAMGPSFYAEADEEKPYLKLKSMALAEGFRKNQLELLGLDALDFFLGTEVLSELQKKSGAQFISTNLMSVTLPFVKKYVEIEYGGFPLLVMAVSAVRTGKLLPKGVAIVEPKKAIEEVLKSLPSKERLVMVLSSMTPQENESLAKAIPQLRMVLGATQSTPFVTLGHGRTLIGSPSVKGRGILRMTLDPLTALGNFFTLDKANTEIFQKSFRAKRLAEIDADLKGKLKSSEKKELLAEKNKISQAMATADPDPMNRKNKIIYDAETVRLFEDLDQPTNELVPLIENYKKAVRDLSLQIDGAK